MRVKKILFSIFIVFIFGKINAQKKVFYDENLKQIDAHHYTDKCMNPVYSCISKNENGLEVYSLKHNFVFGKLNTKEKAHIHSLLDQQLNNNLEKNKTLVFIHFDSIGEYKTNKPNKIKHNTSLKPKKPLTDGDFILHEKVSVKTIKARKKCRQKAFKKFGTSFLHVNNRYQNDKNNSTYSIQDTLFLKNKFFNSKNSFRYLFLKSDGEYLLSYIAINSDQMDKILKEEDWSQFKLDLSASMHTNTTTGIGYFRKELFITKTKCL